MSTQVIVIYLHDDASHFKSRLGLHKGLIWPLYIECFFNITHALCIECYTFFNTRSKFVFSGTRRAFLY